MQEISFATSNSGAEFHIEDETLIKHGKNLYGSGLMQLQHNTGLKSNIFSTPRVYGLGDDHIAMSYLDDALTFSEYLTNCTAAKAAMLTGYIVRYVNANVRHESIFIHPEIISNKIFQISERLQNANDIALSRDLNAALGKSPIEIQVGDYHGDLTFNNILIDEYGVPYLIDFLPGYAPTHWLDVVKLQQEVSLRWSTHFVSCDSNYDCALNILKPYLERFFDGRDGQTLRLMEAVNYLRILPYVKNNSTISSLLRTSIKSILK